MLFRKALFLLGLLLTLPLAQDLLAHSAPTSAWPECYCTDRDGKRHDLGKVICMEVDGRQFTARCEMAQNNPMWREQATGCLGA